jgi:probable rRNA maturation factor
LDVQVVEKLVYSPSIEQFQCWVDTALSKYDKDTELVIRIVDEQEIAVLNEQFRRKKGVTNILSFPFDAPGVVDLDLLGDLVICAAVVERESKQQLKELDAHWAHIVIHGVLHLLGFDHIEEKDAERMEAKEIKILQKMNISNPYLETDQ